MRVRLLPRTIRGLAATAAITLCLTTSLLGLLIYAVVHEEIERQIDQRILNESRALLDYHRDYGLEALVKVVRTRDREPAPVEIGYLVGTEEKDRTMGHIVTDATGKRLIDTLDSTIPPPGWSEFLTFTKPDGSKAIAQAMNSALPGGGRLIVAADRSVVDHMDLAILKLFLGAFAVMAAMSLLATIGLGRIIRQRLNVIEDDAGAIMAGDMRRRMALDGSGGEFDRLAEVLNRMLDRINALVDNLRQVSSDIAHDMRTPLTRLRRRLELAEQGDAKAHIAAAGDAAEDLLGLFEALLAISEVEGQSVRKRFVPVVWDDAIRDLVEAYRPAFTDAGKTIGTRLVPAIVRGDRRLLQQCLANLLDNVLAHTDGPTHVHVDLSADGQMMVLRVADDGPGVPEGDHRRIFERLTRLDSSRSGNGHGLGLNMVRAIIEAHAGTAHAVPSPQGLTIEITLPIAVSSGE